MCNSCNVQTLLTILTFLFVAKVDLQHTHLRYCGVSESSFQLNTHTENINTDYHHTESRRTEDISQLPFCRMSSGNQANQQLCESCGDEDEEVVSKYFVLSENVKSDVDSMDAPAGKVSTNLDSLSTNVDSMDTTAAEVSTNVDLMVDTTTGKVYTNLDSVETIAGKVSANVDSMDSTAGEVSTNVDSLSTNVDSMDTTAGEVFTNVDLMDDTTTGKVSTNIDSVETIAGTVSTYVNSLSTNVDFMDTTAGEMSTNVDSMDDTTTGEVSTNVNSVETIAEKVSTNVDIIDTTAGQVSETINFVDSAARKISTNVDSMDTTTGKVSTNVDSMDSTAGKVSANVDCVDTTSEKVKADVDAVASTARDANTDANFLEATAHTVNSDSTMNPLSEKVNSNEKDNSHIDSVAAIAEEKNEAVVNADYKICTEDCLKEKTATPNDEISETLEDNIEVEDMLVEASISNEESQATEIAENCDFGQSLDNEEVTQNLEDADTSEKETKQYTRGDFESQDNEHDLERETDGENAASLVNEDEKRMSAGDSESSEWKVWTKNSKTKAARKEKKKKAARKENKNKGEKRKLEKRFSDVDTENYRLGYPDKEDDDNLNSNIRFYKGEIPSSPDGALIDDIHKNWRGDYKRLECHHGYIQWLFPIRENGMNWQAQPLQLHEAEAIKADPEARKRILESYKLMLDFYGMKLVDEESGTLARSENWKQRFENLNRSSHNFLRITRILKCLGEMGYEHLKKGLIQFVLAEALEHHTLVPTLDSCRDYWIGTIKNDEDREELYSYIDRFQS